jgi:hypothetical protein
VRGFSPAQTVHHDFIPFVKLGFYAFERFQEMRIHLFLRSDFPGVGYDLRFKFVRSVDFAPEHDSQDREYDSQHGGKKMLVEELFHGVGHVNILA